MSVFYDHLLEINDLDRELEELALDYHEKAHLLDILDSTLHHAVMDTILSEIPTHSHHEFLQNFAISPHDPAHLEFLVVHSPQIETKIRDKARRTKEKFRAEVRKVKPAKPEVYRADPPKKKTAKKK
jgi:hypothetical protein